MARHSETTHEVLRASLSLGAMTDPIPERGGAYDFVGQITPDYAPHRDGDPDPGEVVWAWVPFEEDHTQGKDRPLIVIGRSVEDPRILIALMLSSKDHDDDRNWFSVGTGNWDSEHRESWARIDRPLALPEHSMRREGGVLDKHVFLSLVEHAVHTQGRKPATVPAGAAPKPPEPAASVSSGSWLGSLWSRVRGRG